MTFEEINGETRLHVAARFGRVNTARHLIELGADTNARNKDGRGPLHLAVTADAEAVFQLLVRSRTCHIDMQSLDGSTALMDAVRFQANNLVEDLINTGAKVNLVDNSGKTGLHWSAAINNFEAAAFLLKNGAKVDAQDNKVMV